MKLPSVRRPSPALVVSMVALFVALSGSAVALQGRNSVDSGDIINQEVKSKDVKDNGVKSQDYKDGSVGTDALLDGGIASADLGDGVVNSAKVEDNTLQDVDLDAGAVGTSELQSDTVGSANIQNNQVRADDLGPVITRSNSTAVPNGSSALLSVTCPGGEVVLGGGGFFTAPIAANKGLQASFAAGNNTWVVVGRNNTGAEQTLNVHARCLQT
jgi:hypothetical protein